MEKLQEWRDEKASELKSIKDHSERKQKLEDIKSEKEYSFSEWQRLFEKWKLNLERRKDGYPDSDVGIYPFLAHEKDLDRESFLQCLTPVEDLIPGINTDKLPSLDSKNITAEDRPKRGFALDDRFSHSVEQFIWNMDIQEFEKFRESYKDKIIVEIGIPHAQTYRLACLLGAKGYIAVERFLYNRLILSMLYTGFNDFKVPQDDSYSKNINTKVDQFDVKPIPFNLVNEDGLEFLKRLPDNSVVPFDFGVGDLFFKKSKEYYDEFGKELGRIIANDSYYLQCNSVPLSLPTEKREVKDNLFPSDHIFVRKIVGASTE